MANLRYLRIVDGSVTKQIDDLGKEYPHTCFPRGGPNSTWLSEQNLTLITEVDISDARDKVENVTPYQSGGKWYTQKVTAYSPPSVTMSDDEKWALVRSDRDSRLRMTDFILVADAPSSFTDKLDAWKTYRQSLRDITKQSDPDNITWPTKPS